MSPEDSENDDPAGMLFNWLSTVAAGRMRKYEVMIIIDPTVEERQVDSLMEKYLKVITDEKGTVDNVDVWGKRRLAYDIQKKSEGVYVVINATCEPATIQEMDRLLAIDEKVMRTKVVRPEIH